VANPYETPKQRREKIGTVRPPRKKDKPTRKEREEEMETAVAAVKKELKKKTKGRNRQR